jgi:hypothetical protein
MNNLYQHVIIRVIRFFEALRPNRNPFDEWRFSEQIRGIAHPRPQPAPNRIFRKLEFSLNISYFQTYFQDAGREATRPVGRAKMVPADSAPCEFYLNREAGELR